MSASVTPIDALCPVPDVSVLEMAVLIVFVRRPGIDMSSLVAEISHWFRSDLRECDVTNPLRRLQHKEWLVDDGAVLRATEGARQKAEFAAKGIVHLAFRDRFFFDVGKLLDVSIVKEDRTHG